ncbi:hypothetical protein ACQRIU_005595 [Beauveria bassiana]
MRAAFNIVRASPSRLCLRPAPAMRLSVQSRSKTSKSGEEGQFKAVTASQSSHEPTDDKKSKPPHKASRPEVKGQAPTAWGSDDKRASEKDNKTNNKQ